MKLHDEWCRNALKEATGAAAQINAIVRPPKVNQGSMEKRSYAVPKNVTLTNRGSQFFEGRPDVE
jgi:hypothetical protein